MKKKNGKFNEKYNITVSSKDVAQKKPVSFVVRKSTIFIIVIGILCVSGLSGYVGVNALMTAKKLEITTQNLNNTTENYHEEIEQLEQNQQQMQDTLSNLSYGIDETSTTVRQSNKWLVADKNAPASADSTPTKSVKQSVEYESGSVNGIVDLLGWFDGGSRVFTRYTEAVVIDMETGLSFNVRRFGGTYHADSEPLTAEDTAIMKQIYSGAWSWDRHAIWVKIGDRYFAASMNGMPHMVNPTPSNNFDGHFCIHFLHSMVHATSKECPRHQEKVMEAFTSADKLEEYLKTNIY